MEKYKINNAQTICTLVQCSESFSSDSVIRGREYRHFCAVFSNIRRPLALVRLTVLMVTVDSCQLTINPETIKQIPRYERH